MTTMPVYEMVDAWNSAGTVFTAIGMNVTDNLSASGSMLIDLQVGGTSQFHVTKSGSIHGKRANFNIASANAPIVSVSNYSLTGSNADSLFDLAGTWNTSGTPTALKLNVTDTASAAASLLLDLQVGGSSRFQVSAKTSETFIAKFSSSGVERMRVGTQTSGTNLELFAGAPNTYIGMGTIGSPDVRLYRDDPNIFAQRNGTNAQTFRIYNTFTDASNYERLAAYFNANDAFIRTESAGTGAPRPLYIGTEGVTNLTFRSNATNRWHVVSSGHFLAAADNTYDIGASGANRPRNLFLGGGITTGANIITNASVSIGSGSTSFSHANRGSINFIGDGLWTLYNNAANDFNRLQFGGTTSSFPALKRSTTSLQVRLADDSAFAAFAGLVDLTATQAADGIGTRGVPQNSRSADYTLVAADAGQHILHPASDNNARTFTIPANSSVAYPVGTVVTFINLINTVTIAITSDTMTLAGSSTTGSRTLGVNGIATAVKVGSTSWLISGTGLS